MDLLGKCRQEGGIQRGFCRILLVVLSVLGGGSQSGPLLAQPANPILPPDAAARAFSAGRDAVRRGNYTLGIQKLQEALATGHVKASDRLGTGRYPVERYDPSYWLGVAYMETGDEARALRYLSRSRDEGVVLAWPEASDLRERLERLEKRVAARNAAAAVKAVPVTPTPTPPPPPPPTPPPSPTAGSPAVTPPPSTATRTSTPSVPQPTPASASPELVRAVVAGLSAADFVRAQEALDRLRQREPHAIEADLLEAVLLGSRYLLDGRRDEALLGRARRALQSYRRRGGPRRSEEVWLSPALTAVLGNP